VEGEAGVGHAQELDVDLAAGVLVAARSAGDRKVEREVRLAIPAVV
jgi:hypothetical protein